MNCARVDGMRHSLTLVLILILPLAFQAEASVKNDLPTITVEDLQQHSDVDKRNILKKPMCFADTGKCNFIHDLIALKCELKTPLKKTNKNYYLVFSPKKNQIVQPVWFDVELSFSPKTTRKNPSNISWLHKTHNNGDEDYLKINRETLSFSARRWLEGSLLEEQKGSCKLRNIYEFILERHLKEASRSFRNRQF